MLKSPAESTKSSSPEISAPAKPISLKRNISVPIPVIEKPADPVTESANDVSSGGEEPEKKVVKISSLTAQERMEMRAKKFGSLSSAPAASDEKLQARAARFGIQSQSVSSTTSTGAAANTSNLEVLKKRAERFGAVLVPELKKAEVEEKLMKRQERFGLADTNTVKTPITGPAGPKKNLSDYEEKALKRLERFKTAA